MNDLELAGFLQYYHDIVNDKIGMGKYQIKQLIFISLNKFMIGVQHGIIMLQIPIQYKITASPSYTSGLILFWYVGQLVGQLLLFFVCRKTKVLFQSCQIVSFLLQLLISVNNSDRELQYFFLMLGFCLEVESVSLNAVVKDIIPEEQLKSQLWLALNVESLGTLTYFTVGFRYMDSVDEGEWRSQIQQYLYLCVVAIAGSLVNLEDSAKNFLKESRYSEGYKRLNEMGRGNQGEYQNLSSDQKDGLAKWAHLYRYFNSLNLRYFELLGSQFARQSCTLAVISILNESLRLMLLLYSLVIAVVFQSYALFFLAFLIQFITFLIISFIDKRYDMFDTKAQPLSIYLILLNIIGQAFIKHKLHLYLLAFASVFVAHPYLLLYYDIIVKSTYPKRINNKAIRWMHLNQRLGGVLLSYYFVSFILESPLSLLPLVFYSCLGNFFIFLYYIAISNDF